MGEHGEGALVRHPRGMVRSVMSATMWRWPTVSSSLVVLGDLLLPCSRPGSLILGRGGSYWTWPTTLPSVRSASTLKVCVLGPKPQR